jgi:hypothetical protein
MELGFCRNGQGDSTCLCWTDENDIFRPAQPILTPVAQILAADIVYDDGDDFGPVKSGNLRINAPCKAVKCFEHHQVRLPLAEDKIPTYKDDPSSYEILPSTMTCWLDARENEELDEDEFSKVRLELCARGVVIAQLAFLDSSHITKAATTHNYYQEKYKRYLQDQNWALVLEPTAGQEGEWKRIGIARIADFLIDGWVTRELCII